MGLIMWMLVGLISGWLTSEVTKGRGRNVLFLNNVLFGILGALGGGLLATNLLNVSDSLTDINLITTVVAFAGAMFILLIVSVLREDRSVV